MKDKFKEIFKDIRAKNECSCRTGLSKDEAAFRSRDVEADDMRSRFASIGIVSYTVELTAGITARHKSFPSPI
jgi:hypothetical protein